MPASNILFDCPIFTSAFGENSFIVGATKVDPLVCSGNFYNTSSDFRFSDKPNFLTGVGNRPSAHPPTWKANRFSLRFSVGVFDPLDGCLTRFTSSNLPGFDSGVGFSFISCPSRLRALPTRRKLALGRRQTALVPLESVSYQLIFLRVRISSYLHPADVPNSFSKPSISYTCDRQQNKRQTRALSVTILAPKFGG